MTRHRQESTCGFRPPVARFLSMVSARHMPKLAISAVVNFWIFGALGVWPILRFIAGIPGEKLRVLKWLFWLQVFWLTVSFMATDYFVSTTQAGWLGKSPFPVITGTVSWLTVIIALLGLGLRCRQSSHQQQHRD